MSLRKHEQIASLITRVDPARIRRDLFYLSADPLPCRVLNYARPGIDQSTLHEADDFIIDRLESLGYNVERELVKVQAFQPDPSVAHGFRRPSADEPWYDAFNLYTRREGSVRPDEAIVVLAHKDSQSWLDKGPGAYDNASGTVGLLEIARLLMEVHPERTVILLFCNEEHWPWTSVAAAERMAASNVDVVSVINVDSIGGKSAEASRVDRATNVTRYSTPEGERIADLMGEINDLYEIGLDQRKAFQEVPNDDDGSFINAGIRHTVLNIGSLPYADPNYHTLCDRPEQVNMKNVAKTVRLTLASALHLGGLRPSSAS